MTLSETLELKLADICARTFAETHPITGLKRLTGGASMETWAFDYGPRELILRRSLASSSLGHNGTSLSVNDEADLIKYMAEHKVSVPAVYVKLSAKDALGEGFIMDRIGGEALPQKIFKSESHASVLEGFVDDCARELAAIHETPPPTNVENLCIYTATDRLDILEQTYREMNTLNPVFNLAFAWLRAHTPINHSLTIVHSDFRMGNLLLNTDGLAAVLDWELSHIGDPLSDLGYLCAPCWRFGRYDHPVGGVGALEDLIQAYEREKGETINLKALQFWMIFSSLWWAITCLGMLDTWRQTEVRTLERTVIGTRVSENEIDLLLMLEEAEGIEQKNKLEFLVLEEAPADGATKPFELATALAEWVSDDLIPGKKGADLFQARVARNALGIIVRQTKLGPVFKERNKERLSALGHTTSSLCSALASGNASLHDKDILAHLRLSALEAVSIDQPKYAGLASARKKWCSLG